MFSVGALAGSRRFRWVAGVVCVALAVTVGELSVPASVTPASASVKAGDAAGVEPVVERPDVVSARLAARLQGSRVEVSGLRSESSTTWANPDGSLTTDDALMPVRVRRGEGWVPVDLSLEQEQARYYYSIFGVDFAQTSRWSDNYDAQGG